MASMVFNASCLAKWPWCEALDVASEACFDEGDDAKIASGSEALEGHFIADRLLAVKASFKSKFRSTALIAAFGDRLKIRLICKRDSQSGSFRTSFAS